MLNRHVRVFYFISGEVKSVIVIDLEWNSGLYTKLRLDEILQIGAVKVDLDRRKIVDSFNVYLRPSVHKRYSPAVTQLPDLALSENSTLTFPTALERFLDWCGGDDLFASWGNSDLNVLIQNRDFHKLDAPLPSTFLDLQMAFDHRIGCGNNLALERAAEYCLVPDSFDPHNALYDAMTAWVVADFLPTSLILEAKREAGAPLPKGQKALPRRENLWRGPFASRELTLSNRGCRRGNCPDCAAVNRVGQWYLAKDGFYYGSFSCRGCGKRYLLRLEVFEDKGGRFWGTTALLSLTKARQDFFHALSKTDPVPTGKKRTRRHRPRRRKRSVPLQEDASPS